MQMADRNTGDRETLWFFPHMSTEKYKISIYNHMLNEDVYSRIMPYRSYDIKTKTPLVQLSSPNELVQKDIILALSGNNHPRYNLEDAVSHFIRECTKIIMYAGQGIYEVVNYTDEITSEISFSKLESVPNGNIKFFFGQPFQILPNMKNFELEEPRFKIITKDKLVLFKMPEPYRSNYKALQSQLDILGKNKVNDLHIKSLEQNSKQGKPRFNQKIKVMDGFKFSDLAVLSATNLMGWNARQYESKYLQEYFTLVRFLRFERFKLKLRNSILDTINKNLSRLVSNSAYVGELQFHGLPTAEDIEEAEKDLRKGNRKFKDIADLFLELYILEP